MFAKAMLRNSITHGSILKETEKLKLDGFPDSD